jgi:Zn-finger nucleic acid-binding protein
MSRHVFGYRSGVVIDQCKGHGVWLDSGEVTHLLEWKKAGGQLLQDKHKLTGHGDTADKLTSPVKDYGFNSDEANVVNALADLLGKLSR